MHGKANGGVTLRVKEDGAIGPTPVDVGQEKAHLGQSVGIAGHASSRRLLKPLGSAAVAGTAIALAALVEGLNERNIHGPNGQRWTEKLLEFELERIAR